MKLTVQICHRSWYL